MKVFLPITLTLITASAASAQSLNDWINARVDSVVAVRLGLRDGARQPQVPAGNASDASLVDRSGMPDILGIAIKLPNQPSSEAMTQPATNSFSWTPYLLWALFKGGALSPETYLGKSYSRRLGLNITFDTDSSGTTHGLIQAKLLVISRGNVLDFDREERVSGALANATDAFGELKRAIQDLLFERAAAQAGVTDKVAFINSLTQPHVLTGYLAAVGTDGQSEIDALILEKIEAFETLRRAVRTLEDHARTRPELSIGITTTTTGTDAERVRALAILDYGGARRELTFNLGYEHVDATGAGARRDRIAGAAQFLWKLSPENPLRGRSAMTLAVAGFAGVSIRDESDHVFKLQAKLAIPIGEGINMPVSATWASRSELIDEAELRGQIGFTVNVAGILSVID